MDNEYGARIYFCAPKLDQARLCYEGFYQTIIKDADMSAMAKKRRTDIYISESNTSAQPLAFSAKKSDGLNPHLTVCDEVAAWQGDAGLKQYEVIKSALGARKQPLVLSISTANFISDGIYDELFKRSTAVLMGNSKETRLAPFLYVIDDVDKWNDINELRKSLPNLGVSVSVDYMLEEIAVAEGSLSKKSEFICKYCNVKQNSSQAWLSAQTIGKGFVNNYTLADFRDSYVVFGADLSKTTDLTAAVCLIQKDGKIYHFSHFWLPSEKIDEAIARDGVPYKIYIEKGWLSLTEGNQVDSGQVVQWMLDLYNQYDLYPKVVGYDKWSSDYFVHSLQSNGFFIDDVRQGTNLTPVINEAEALIKDGILQSGDQNDLMKIHMLDASIQMFADSGLRKLVKINKNCHIDGMAALLDALCVRQKYWNEFGNQLENVG